MTGKMDNVHTGLNKCTSSTTLFMEVQRHRRPTDQMQSCKHIFKQEAADLSIVAWKPSWGYLSTKPTLIFRGFQARMVYQDYITCSRYTILVRNPGFSLQLLRTMIANFHFVDNHSLCRISCQQETGLAPVPVTVMGIRTWCLMLLLCFTWGFWCSSVKESSCFILFFFFFFSFIVVLSAF